jgi:hypothetical protein
MPRISYCYQARVVVYLLLSYIYYKTMSGTRSDSLYTFSLSQSEKFTTDGRGPEYVMQKLNGVVLHRLLRTKLERVEVNFSSLCCIRFFKNMLHKIVAISWIV